MNANDDMRSFLSKFKRADLVWLAAKHDMQKSSVIARYKRAQLEDLIFDFQSEHPDLVLFDSEFLSKCSVKKKQGRVKKTDKNSDEQQSDFENQVLVEDQKTQSVSNTQIPTNEQTSVENTDINLTETDEKKELLSLDSAPELILEEKNQDNETEIIEVKPKKRPGRPRKSNKKQPITQEDGVSKDTEMAQENNSILVTSESENLLDSVNESNEDQVSNDTLAKQEVSDEVAKPTKTRRRRRKKQEQESEIELLESSEDQDQENKVISEEVRIESEADKESSEENIDSTEGNSKRKKKRSKRNRKKVSEDEELQSLIEDNRTKEDKNTSLEESEPLLDDLSEDEEEKKVEENAHVFGVLEIMVEGYGFLRCENYLQGSNDIYVPHQHIRRFNLRNGDLIEASVRRSNDRDRYQALSYIHSVNDLPPEKLGRRSKFDKLTPIYPNERYHLEYLQNDYASRIIDLISPIGRGQRAMIVSPPKAGKTILLQKIAAAIAQNHPSAKLMVLLIDERPEEVTDMQRHIQGEVAYSTFDKTPENHVRIAELLLERAKRLVELGEDVVILLDSITRLARAYNLTINPTGRTLSGGLDPGSLYGPKRFFGAARNIEGGGSLTIIATALIETGSRMDEVIFEEFKGTGNMEVVLDRKMAEKRIFPAIDVMKSGTRREDLLLTKEELEAAWSIRRHFSGIETHKVTAYIMELMKKVTTNSQFTEALKLVLKNKNVE